MEREDLTWRDIWLPGLLFAALTVFPYLVAWLSAPAGWAFAGALVNPDDLPVYLSAMRQGAAGGWLFHFTFSPEPWQPRLMLLPYILAGKVVGFLRIDLLMGFHLLRITAVFLAQWALLIWVRTLFPGARRRQQTTWLLLLFGSGLGWLWATAVAPEARDLVPDLLGPEWSVFMALFHTPHFALGLALEVLLFAQIVRLRRDGRWGTAVAAAGTGLAAGLTYVYLLPVAGLLIGVVLLWEAGRRRRIPWRFWLQGGVVLLPLTLLLLYYAWLVNLDPYFADYAANEHVIPPPPFAGALIGSGFVGLFALFGGRVWAQERLSPLVPLWIGTNLAALYLPFVDFSGRFALGLMIPVGTMAGVGVEEVLLPWLQARHFYEAFSRYTPTPRASLRRVLLGLTLPTTLIIPFWLARSVVGAAAFPTYLPQADLTAAAWLGERAAAGELILADYPLGNALPRYTAARLFVAQLDYTTDLPGKLAELARFWAGETAVRTQIIADWGVDYLFLGTYEQQQFSGPDPPPGELIYDRDGVQIFAMEE